MLKTLALILVANAEPADIALRHLRADTITCAVYYDILEKNLDRTDKAPRRRMDALGRSIQLSVAAGRLNQMLGLDEQDFLDFWEIEAKRLVERENENGITTLETVYEPICASILASPSAAFMDRMPYYIDPAL